MISDIRFIDWKWKMEIKVEKGFQWITLPLSGQFKAATEAKINEIMAQLWNIVTSYHLSNAKLVHFTFK